MENNKLSLEFELLSAAGVGDIAVLRRCLAVGAAATARDKDGWTPLMLTCRYGFLECVKLLLAAGAENSLRDGTGRTALMHAASHGRAGCVKLLLESGACVHDIDNYGNSALVYARDDTYTHSEDCARIIMMHIERSTLKTATVNDRSDTSLGI